MRRWIDSREEAFEVDASGFIGLHRARRPDEIVRELYQNVADLADATFCEITIRGELGGSTILSVADDGPGYSDISDAWTLYRETPKWLDPEIRGRFNRGNKEAAAYARSMTVYSGSLEVEFPAEGGRRVYEVPRRKGSLVVAEVDWDADTIDEVVNRVFEYRPTELALSVNGIKVPERKPVATARERMRTVMATGPGEPLRHTWRVADIDILARSDEAEGWVMELGIPVQKCGIFGYDVDVRQKIPLSERRNEITLGYQSRLKGYVMNVIHRLMSPDAFGENWVREAMLDDRITPVAFDYASRKAFGERPVMRSSNIDANMRAVEDGRDVIDGRSVGRELADKLRSHGVPSAGQLYGRRPPMLELDPFKNGFTLEDSHREFTTWALRLANMAGFDAKVAFVHEEGTGMIASCTANTQNPTLTFNVGHPVLADPAWFAGRGPEQMGFIFHELGHAEANTPMEHGPRWGEGVAAVAARIAVKLAR